MTLGTLWLSPPCFPLHWAPGDDCSLSASVSLTTSYSTYKWDHTYLSFCVWLISLSITSSRSIHAVTNGGISFLLKVLCNSWLKSHFNGFALFLWRRKWQYAWRIPWIKEPGRLQSMVLQRVRHDWETVTHSLTFFLTKYIWLFIFLNTLSFFLALLSTQIKFLICRDCRILWLICSVGEKNTGETQEIPQGSSNQDSKEFLGGPVVKKTPCFHCLRGGFSPWSGN